MRKPTYCFLGSIQCTAVGIGAIRTDDSQNNSDRRVPVTAQYRYLHARADSVCRVHCMGCSTLPFCCTKVPKADRSCSMRIPWNVGRQRTTRLTLRSTRYIRTPLKAIKGTSRLLCCCKQAFVASQLVPPSPISMLWPFPTPHPEFRTSHTSGYVDTGR